MASHWLGRLCGATLLTLTLLAESRPAAASDDDGLGFTISTVGTQRYRGRFYEAGAFFGGGGPLSVNGYAGSMPGAAGVRVLEHNGYISKFTISTLVALAVGLAGDKEYVGSTYQSYGNVTVRTDYYRQRSDAEMKALREAPAKAFDNEYVVELAVYAPGMLGTWRDRPQVKGFEFYLGDDWAIGKGDQPFMLGLGFVGSWLTADGMQFNAGAGPYGSTHTTGPHSETLKYLNLGMYFRFSAPITSFAEAFLSWDANFVGLLGTSLGKIDSDGQVQSSPLRLGIYGNITDRLYVRGYGTMNLPTTNFGWTLEAGVRL